MILRLNDFRLKGFQGQRILWLKQGIQKTPQIQVTGYQEDPSWRTLGASHLKRVYDSVRQRYNFLGLVSLFATTHPPICPQVTLDLLPPLVVPTFLLLPPPHSFSPLVVRRSFLCFFVCLCVKALKGSWPGFRPKEPFPNGPRRGFSLPAQRPSNGRKLLPRGSWPGVGPKGPFPNGPRRGF